VTVATASSLLASLVDYAGLFPPAQLGMDAAVQRFAAHRGSREAWMLGRFVVPARRLLELAAAADAHLPAPGSAEPWRLSALLGDDVAADAVLAAGFGERARGRAVVDTVELKAETPEEIEKALDAIPRDLTAYVELPLRSDLPPLLSVLRTRRARAKIRTGGLTPDAIPTVEDVARFLSSCSDAGVAFKATAGLHHPVRGDQPLTYEADGPRATMHGFLNVFAAAALAHRGAPAADLEAVLCEERPTAFRFLDGTLHVGERRLTADDLAAARADFAIGFGSCSFDEPVAGLKALRML
jgi:hypothetical protein